VRLPSASRLAAAGLGIAALVIVALAALALAELEREAELHRDVIAAMQAKESLESLRLQLTELGVAARLVGATGDAEGAQRIEARSVEAEAELAYLAQYASREDGVAAFARLRQAVAGLSLQARSVAALRATRGTQAAVAAAGAAEGAQREALAAVASLLDARTGRLNQRTLDQIRLGESLRAYVSWLLAGSILVLIGLFATYRWAALRERAARERIEHMAHYDTVTGLPNRALLADRLGQEAARARRTGGGYAVLMTDLDGFKEVNDRWGHAAGDRVLALVAQRAAQCVRASDTVGRVGGDEFMAILPEATLAGATAVAEKIVRALAEPYQVDKGEARLSASAGVAVYPADGEDADSVQRAADAALYQAKREGKNRVRTARGEAPATITEAG
jgi:diguanylate cyclase (GGDEF)-like protein